MKKFACRVVYFCLFLSFLVSMNVWITWNSRVGRYFNVILTGIIIVSLFAGKIKLAASNRHILSFVLLATAHVAYNFHYINLWSIVLLFCALFIYWVIIAMNAKNKYDGLSFLTTCYTLLLVTSLIGWLIDFASDIPAVGIVQWEDQVVSYDIYENHILFLKATSLGYMYRFSGPFLEPGHCGMMTAFLLFANRFNYKDWRVIALSIVLLFTLSLAGYVLMAIGYVFNNMKNITLIIKRTIIALIIIVPVYYYSLDYNHGFNFINENIIERLQPDEEKGFTGNNRVFGDIDIYFHRMWHTGKYLWTGYPEHTMISLAKNDSRGTGYIMYIMSFGLLGLLVTSLFYIYYAMTARNKRYALLFFIFVCAAFWQRCYPFWTSWIICYVWGLSVYDALNCPAVRERRNAWTTAHTHTVPTI